MKVGDLIRLRKEGDIGIIVGINPLDGRFMVKWNDMPKPYPELCRYLEIISESR